MTTDIYLDSSTSEFLWGEDKWHTTMADFAALTDTPVDEWTTTKRRAHHTRTMTGEQIARRVRRSTGQFTPAQAIQVANVRSIASADRATIIIATGPTPSGNIRRPTRVVTEHDPILRVLLSSLANRADWDGNYRPPWTAATKEAGISDIATAPLPAIHQYIREVCVPGIDTRRVRQDRHMLIDAKELVIALTWGVWQWDRAAMTDRQRKAVDDWMELPSESPSDRSDRNADDIWLWLATWYPDVAEMFQTPGG